MHLIEKLTARNKLNQMVDQLVTAKWIIPLSEKEIFQDAASVLENHTIAIAKDKIVEILPTEEASLKYPQTACTTLAEHILIPGLINAHTHAAMSLFRGMADDLPLKAWLEEQIWPAEGRWVSENFVRDGTELAIAEMLRGGITCFNDMYFFPNAVCKAGLAASMRTVISFPVLDFPSAWASNADDYIHKGLQLNDDFKNHPLIHIGFGPHAPYTVSDKPLEKVAMYAEELDTHIHMHVNETEQEVQEAIEATGLRPIMRLESLGLLSPRFNAVHMTHVSKEELRRFSKAGAHIIHCPESNLKLASGLAPIVEMQTANINVALGTDGSASNNDLDMIGELRTTALLAKAVAKDASSCSAKQALQMATIQAAQALGLSKHIGSLEAGKQADITAIDCSELEMLPMYNPVSQLVYANSRKNVTDVWVAGQRLLNNRQLSTLDVNDIRQKTLHWADRIKAG